MNIIILIIYIWLTILFLWYGRHVNAGFGQKPLILTSSIFILLFNLLGLIWIILSIILLFKNWQLSVFSFLGIFLIQVFIPRLAQVFDDLALIPISYLYKLMTARAEKKERDEERLNK